MGEEIKLTSSGRMKARLSTGEKETVTATIANVTWYAWLLSPWVI